MVPHDQPRRRRAQRQQRARRRVRLVQDDARRPARATAPGPAPGSARPTAPAPACRPGPRRRRPAARAWCAGPRGRRRRARCQRGGGALAQRRQHRLHAAADGRIELADVQHPHRAAPAISARTRSCTRATCRRTSKRSTIAAPALARPPAGPSGSASARSMAAARLAGIAAADAERRQPRVADDLVGAATPRPHDRALARHRLGDHPAERLGLHRGVHDHVEAAQHLRARRRDGRQTRARRPARARGPGVAGAASNSPWPLRTIDLAPDDHEAHVGRAGGELAAPPPGTPPAPSSAPARRPCRPGACPAGQPNSARSSARGSLRPEAPEVDAVGDRVHEPGPRTRARRGASATADELAMTAADRGVGQPHQESLPPAARQEVAHVPDDRRAAERRAGSESACVLLPLLCTSSGDGRRAARRTAAKVGAAAQAGQQRHRRSPAPAQARPHERAGAAAISALTPRRAASPAAGRRPGTAGAARSAADRGRAARSSRLCSAPPSWAVGLRYRMRRGAVTRQRPRASDPGEPLACSAATTARRARAVGPSRPSRAARPGSAEQARDRVRDVGGIERIDEDPGLAVDDRVGDPSRAPRHDGLAAQVGLHEHDAVPLGAAADPALPAGQYEHVAAPVPARPPRRRWPRPTNWTAATRPARRPAARDTAAEGRRRR